jgi:hypothetical protein
LHRPVSRAVAGLAVDRHALGDIEHRNDAHGGILSIPVAR